MNKFIKKELQGEVLEYLELCVGEMRTKAQQVGPLHGWWDYIHRAEELLAKVKGEAKPEDSAPAAGFTVEFEVPAGSIGRIDGFVVESFAKYHPTFIEFTTGRVADRVFFQPLRANGLSSFREVCALHQVDLADLEAKVKVDMEGFYKPDLGSKEKFGSTSANFDGVEQPLFWLYVCDADRKLFHTWPERSPAGPVAGWTEYQVYLTENGLSSKPYVGSSPEGAEQPDDWLKVCELFGLSLPSTCDKPWVLHLAGIGRSKTSSVTEAANKDTAVDFNHSDFQVDTEELMKSVQEEHNCILGDGMKAKILNALVRLSQHEAHEFEYRRIKDQAYAWAQVCELLGELDPEWASRASVEPKTGIDSALYSIRNLASLGVPAKTNAWHHGCKSEGWQCFHCGEVFTTVGGAQDHFGADPTKEPGCLIKVKYGNERGLEMELRKVEAERDKLWHQISNESTEADLRIQTLQGEHRLALQREEEKGYARGLFDGQQSVLGGEKIYVVECLVYDAGAVSLHRNPPSQWPEWASGLSKQLPRGPLYTNTDYTLEVIDAKGRHIALVRKDGVWQCCVNGELVRPIRIFTKFRSEK